MLTSMPAFARRRAAHLAETISSVRATDVPLNRLVHRRCWQGAAHLPLTGEKGSWKACRCGEEMGGGRHLNDETGISKDDQRFEWRRIHRARDPGIPSSIAFAGLPVGALDPAGRKVFSI
jgi:hypothetical protein